MKIHFAAYTYKNLQDKEAFCYKDKPNMVYKPTFAVLSGDSGPISSDFKVNVDVFTRVSSKPPKGACHRLMVNGQRVFYQKATGPETPDWTWITFKVAPCNLREDTLAHNSDSMETVAFPKSKKAKA